MATQTLNTLQETFDNYCRILLLLTRVIATPTQANIDAVVSLAAGTGIVGPKPTTTVDGETYDWVGYQSFIIDKLEPLRKMIILLGGPFEVQSRARY